MKLAEVQAQAATKVITTADEMVGSLIDVTV
jgi:flagellar hook-associated protein FlgK